MQRRKFFRNIVGLLAAKEIAVELAKPKYTLGTSPLLDMRKQLERALWAGEIKGRNPETFKGVMGTLKAESLERSLRILSWSEKDKSIGFRYEK